MRIAKRAYRLVKGLAVVTVVAVVAASLSYVALIVLVPADGDGDRLDAEDDPGRFAPRRPDGGHATPSPTHG